MEASHKTHRPHIKVGKDEEEECKLVQEHTRQQLVLMFTRQLRSHLFTITLYHVVKIDVKSLLENIFHA